MNHPDAGATVPPLRVLIVEDDPTDAELMQRALTRDDVAHSAVRAQDRDQLIRALEVFHPDLILSDFHLPALNGRAVLQLVRERYPEIPVIIVTGALGDESAAELIRAGARDYVLKDRMARLAPAVRRVLADEQVRRQHAEDEAHLQESELRFRRLFESAREGILILDYESGAIIEANPFVLSLFGCTKDEIVCRPLWEIDLFRPIVESALAFEGLQQSRHIHRDGLELQTRRGAVIEVELVGSVYRSAELRVMQLTIRDITERRRAEARLRLMAYLVETSPTILFRWRPDAGWPVAFVSENIALWGYTADEFLSGRRDYASIVHPDDRARVGREVEAYTQQGTDSFTQQYRVIDATGRTHWVDDRTVVERDAHGAVHYFQGAVMDVTERQEAILRAQAQLQALSEVARADALIGGDVHALARQVTETATRVTGAERANVWLFNDAETELHCIDLYEATPSQHSAGLVLRESEFANEFHTLKTSHFVDADDPLTDPRTAGYVDSYLRPQGITSMLDVVVQISGRHAGLLCIEHVGKAHRWQADEIGFAIQIADQLGFCLTTAQRRDNERSLQRLNRALKTLSAGNSAVVHAETEDALLQSMCAAIVDIGGYAMAWVGYAEHDEARSVRPMAWAGDGADYVAQARLSWGEGERGLGGGGRSLRSGEPVVVRDIAAEPSMAPWHEAAHRNGYRSVLVLPLAVDSAVLGALMIYSRDPAAFSDDELSLLTEMAGDLSYGIAALRTKAAHDAGLRRLEQSMEATVQALASTVERRDPYTAGHQRRVAEIATAIAREMGLTEDTVHGLHLAAIVHDVGKINVPAEILAKPGQLSPVERELIRVHPTAGYEILKGVHFEWPVAEIVLQHHERIDGSGYPRGLKGDDILIEARILAVADTVEAIASHRPYRPARGIDAALAEIEAGRGTLFCAEAVDACLRLFRERGYRIPD